MDSKELENSQRTLEIGRRDIASAKRSRDMEALGLRLLPWLTLVLGAVSGLAVSAHSDRSSSYPYAFALLAASAGAPSARPRYLRSAVLSVAAFLLGFLLVGGMSVQTMYGTYDCRRS